MSTRELAKLIEELPAEDRGKIEHFAKQHWSQRAHQPSDKTYSFSWAGGLRELRDHYTSVELQHKASE